MRPAARIFLSCLAVASVVSTASAQDRPPRGEQPAGERPARGPGGPGGGGGGGGAFAQLAPEKAKAAWEAQAKSVSKRLSLSEDQTKAVTKAYAEARESYSKASQKMREESREKMRDENADRRALMAEQMKAMQELEKTERAKLEKALSSTLSAEQSTKALGAMGRFSAQWDMMTDALVGFNLEAAKLQTAMDTVETFVTTQPAIGRQQQQQDADMEKLREEQRQRREKLHDELAKVLSEDQLKKFEDTAMRGGGRGRGPAGGEGGDGERPRRNRENGGG